MFLLLMGAEFLNFTSSPLFFSRPKKTVLCSTRNCALSWKVPEKSSTLGASLDLCLIAEFSTGQFDFFSLSFHPPLLAKFLESSRKFPESLPAKSARLSANRGAPGIPARGACATRPGFSPLRAQFRFGVANDWSSFLFLGLGEFWCEHVGSFIKK